MDYLSSLHEDTHEVTSVDNELSTPVSASTEARQIMNGVHNQLKGATVWMAKSSLSPSPACGASWSTTTPTAEELGALPTACGQFMVWHGTLDVAKALRRMRQQEQRSQLEAKFPRRISLEEVPLNRRSSYLRIR
jgi:hypothetical protein